MMQRCAIAAAAACEGCRQSRQQLHGAGTGAYALESRQQQGDKAGIGQLLQVRRMLRCTGSHEPKSAVYVHTAGCG